MCTSNKIDCPRCGGSGKVEHTHVVDGICFMCKGFGQVYPERVGELTEKAKKRKAASEQKKAEILEQFRANDEEWSKQVSAEITKRNIEFLNNYKCRNTDVIKSFFEQVKGISKVLNIDSNSSEQEVRNMFNDFFKKESFNYRLEVSKYTLKFHNFSFIDLSGDKSDLTECKHEVQNLIKK